MEKLETATDSPEKLLGDLYGVGTDKPLGYLPLPTLTNICHVDVEKLQEELEQKGLSTFVLNDQSCDVSGGALIVFDKIALQNLLDANKETLLNSSCPASAKDFALYVMTHFVSHKTPLFDLIADAFADTTNRGRSDVESSN